MGLGRRAGCDACVKSKFDFVTFEQATAGGHQMLGDIILFICAVSEALEEAPYSCKVLLRLDNDLIPWLGSRPISSIEAGRASGHYSACRAPGSTGQRASMPGDIEPDIPLCDRYQPGQAKSAGATSRSAAPGAGRQPLPEHHRPRQSGRVDARYRRLQRQVNDLLCFATRPARVFAAL